LATELEVKAVITDPDAVRRSLETAGARLDFRGLMRDRRFDRDGGLSQRDEVLRVRVWQAEEVSHQRAQVAWKGPTSRNAAGYKQRQEIEFAAEDGVHAVRFLEALGYQVVEAIDRFVEVRELHGTVARLEWYPRMDVLLEIEGTEEGIEELIRVVGIPRDQCLSDSLIQFAARYSARTGTPAILAEAGLNGAAPTWAHA
jgi:adenylate cyclase class IV